MTAAVREPTGLGRTGRALKHRLIGLRDRVLLSDRWSSRWAVRGPDRAHRPFFLIGAPRSGSTLLRAILSLNPDLFIPPENGGIGTMIRAFGAHRTSEWPVVVDAVIDAFQQGYEFDHWDVDGEAIRAEARALPEDARSLTELFEVVYRAYGARHAPGKARWADKTVSGSAGYLDKLSLAFPHCQYVHLVRDGRDSVASALKARMFGRSAAVAAYGWRDSVHRCRTLGDRLGSLQYLELRYEDLVTNPAAEIRRVCDFVGLTPTSDMLEYAGARDVEDVNRIDHHENVRRPIFADSIGKWKRQLSPDAVEDVTRILHSELARFGYR